jgi:large subunit ribosomal protein L10
LTKEEKIKAVEELKKEIDQSEVVGILDMFKLPSRQFQQIQKKIRGKTKIRVVKKSILMFAIKASEKPGIKSLEQIVPQQPAIFFTGQEPFKFYFLIDKMKSPVAAKEGDVAPNDILVNAGPTNLLPGPAISELTRAGIPAGVEEGKIAVKKDVVVAKKGDKISKMLAAALRKLKIEPVEVGLNVVAICHNGMIYKKEALDFVNVFPSKLIEAFNQALNLSVAISYPTKENIGHLLAKGYRIASGLKNKIGGLN